MAVPSLLALLIDLYLKQDLFPLTCTEANAHMSHSCALHISCAREQCDGYCRRANRFTLIHWVLVYLHFINHTAYYAMINIRVTFFNI